MHQTRCKSCTNVPILESSTHPLHHSDTLPLNNRKTLPPTVKHSFPPRTISKVSLEAPCSYIQSSKEAQQFSLRKFNRSKCLARGKRKRLESSPSSSVFSFFLSWSILASRSPFSSFRLFSVRVPKLPGFWFSVSSSASSRTSEYSSWFVMPIFVQITTMRLATGWLSSTSNVFSVPSSMRTLRVRSLRLYSSRSPFLSK